MATDDPHGVVTRRSDGSIDQLLRRAVVRIEGLGLDVVAVIDHSGDAAEAGVTIPEAKLVLFGSPSDAIGLLPAHPRLALDLPFRLLIADGGEGDGHAFVSYEAPDHLERRHGLTDGEAEALLIVERIAQTL